MRGFDRCRGLGVSRREGKGEDEGGVSGYERGMERVVEEKMNDGRVSLLSFVQRALPLSVLSVSLWDIPHSGARIVRTGPVSSEVSLRESLSIRRITYDDDDGGYF